MNSQERELFWNRLVSLPGEDIQAEYQMLFNTIKLPKYLYRYRPVNMKSLEALRTNRLYFSSANYYDDPFDTFLHINIEASIMILEALKSLYPNSSEKVLIAVKEDLEKLRGKQASTVELVDWMDKLVVAHKIEDDSKPTCVGNESSFVYVEGSDEIND